MCALHPVAALRRLSDSHITYVGDVSPLGSTLQTMYPDTWVLVSICLTN